MANLATREPAVAGTFYPANPAALRKNLAEFFSQATVTAAPGGRLQAVVAPHAGYIYSGPIAAHAFKALSGAPPPKRVFLMGPAHFVAVPGVALGGYGAFATPLGTVPVDVETVQAMLKAQPALYVQGTVAHAPEHCLEVELPFLQHSLSGMPDTHIVPMLYGMVDPEAVARDLHARLGDDDLIVVSSDLSHYHDYETARKLDGSFLQDVLRGDIGAAEDGEACGKAPIVTLMHLARLRDWTPVLLDARNSGDTAGDRWRVVGYASVGYYGHTAH